MTTAETPRRRKIMAYRRLFAGDDPQGDAKIVLNDLRRLCRATESTVAVSSKTGMIDTHAMALAEGRREVWLMIMKYLYLSDKTIIQLTED